MIAIIMAGGSGTRFWPMSNEKHPKQFLKLFDNKSMIQLTYERVLSFIKPDDIYIVTTLKQVELILEHIPEINKSQLIIEPCGMNTAPCIALAICFLMKKYPETTPCLVLPADHYIPDTVAFSKAMTFALESCSDINSQNLVTFGIVPTYPATGYGYIEASVEISPSMFHVKHFKEKPELKIAEEFLQKGNYFWNSGMFCWTLKTIFNSYLEHESSIIDVINKLPTNSEPESQLLLYKAIKKVPIDIAILEKSKNVIVIPLNFIWSDVGSWFSLSELFLKDRHSNYLKKSGYVKESEGNFVISEKIVALIGVQDLVVVATEDALLIMDKSRAEEVKYIGENIARKL